MEDTYIYKLSSVDFEVSFFFCQTAQGERLRFAPFCSAPNRVTPDSAVNETEMAAALSSVSKLRKLGKTFQHLGHRGPA